MQKNRFATLENMTTREIAAEVDAGIPYRGFQYRCWTLARKGAYSFFVLQYLLLYGTHIAWIVPIVLLVVAAELYTNRSVMTTYSTRSIVDLIMKRDSIEKTRYRYVDLALIGAAVCFFSFVLGQLGMAGYRCQVYFFAGTALVLFYFKSADPPTNARSRRIVHTPADGNRFYVAVNPYLASAGFGFTRPWYGLYGLNPFVYCAIYLTMIILLLAYLVVYANGGINYQNSGNQLIIIFAVLFSIVGCRIHELSRFYLVDRAMGRLNETKSRELRENDATMSGCR